MSDPDDDDGYTPEAIGLCDGEVILFDPTEFEVDFDAYGVMVREGCLFYLDKATKQWVNVENHGKPRGNLRKVQ